MIRDTRHPARRAASRRYNFAAALVAGGAIALMYYNFEAAIADEAMPNVAPQLTDLSSIDDTAAQPLAAQTEQNSTTTVATENTAAAQSADSDLASDSDRYAVMFAISQMQRGIEKLERISTYTTILERQERIAGELKDQQQIELKLRHAPFSVYMKWLNGDKGRQLLYADQKNEGRMLVKLGGFKGRLLPTLKIDPFGDRAMSESRHPVTQAGLVNLAHEIISHRKKDLACGILPECTIEAGHQFDNRPCYKMVIEYPRRSPEHDYRKAITLIDQELSLPVFVKNYTWPSENTVDVEAETMIECYAYTNIQIEEQLAETVWAEDNPRYRFVR